MSKYIGKIVRDVRLSKNITQEELSEGICTPTFLSKFERGENDIASEKLFLLLEKLNFSLFETNTLISDSRESNQQTFLSELSKAVKSDNVHHLERLMFSEEQLYKQFKNERHYHNVILTKQFINRINKVPYDNLLANEIFNYLFQIDDWYYYELSLFSHSSFFLPIDKIIFLINIAFKKGFNFSHKKHYRSELGNVLINVIILMLEKDELDYAHKFIIQIEKYLTDTRFYDQITKVNFLKGLYLIKKGSIEEGKSLATEAISIMNYMKDYSQSLSHQKYLDNFPD